MITRALTHSTLGTQNKIHKRVLYIDTDTVFTAYLMAGLILKDHYQASIDIIHNLNKKNNSGDPSCYNSNNNNNNNDLREGEENNVSNDIIFVKSKNRDERLVQVFLPSEGKFESLLSDAIASMPEASIVIFDSLNSFYNMYPTRWYESEITEQQSSKKQLAGTSKVEGSAASTQQPGNSLANQRKKQSSDLSKEDYNTSLPIQPQTPREENREVWSKTIKSSTTATSQTAKSPYTIGRLNHLLSIYIMLLVQHGLFYKIPVLVTSMVRYKKVSEDVWIKAPACRRLLNQKSVVRLSVDMLNENDLSVNIIKHPSLEQQTIVYSDVGISLVSPSG
jgi:hypothetical protein